MEDVDNMAFWHAVMGNSDDDCSDFEGFELTEITKRDVLLFEEDSDFDSDILVEPKRLQRGESDNSEDEDDEDEDDVLPTVAVRKRKKTTKKANKEEIKWTEKTSEIVLEDDFDVGITPVGPQHELTPDSNEYEYFSLFFPESFWTEAAKQTNIYADQEQQKKGQGKSWTPTSAAEMKAFIYIHSCLEFTACLRFLGTGPAILLNECLPSQTSCQEIDFRHCHNISI